MLDLQAGEQSLAHRTDGDGRGQKPGSMLRRPSPGRRSLIVVPSHVPVGQALALKISRLQHARNGQDGLGRAVAEGALHRTKDAAVNLSGDGASGHCEVQDRHLSGGEQPDESP